jgi:hypothetical protein
VTLSIDTSALHLTLPIEACSADTIELGSDRLAPDTQDAGATEELAQPPTRWSVTQDVLARVTTCRSSYGSRGTLPDGGQYAEQYDGEVGVPVRDPAAAWASGTTRYELDWADDQCHVEARFRVQSDAANFNVTIELDATHNGVPLRQRRWSQAVPRHLG